MGAMEDADIDPVFQHMSGEAIAQGVATNPLVDPCCQWECKSVPISGIEKCTTHPLGGCYLSR